MKIKKSPPGVETSRQLFPGKISKDWIRKRKATPFRVAPDGCLGFSGIFMCLAIFLCFLGCSTHEPYQGPPEMEIGENWTFGSGNEVDISLEKWWEAFNDPVLTGLIRKGRACNLDIRQAVLRIQEARAMVAGARGGYYPGLNLEADVTRRRQSENGPLPITLLPGIDRDQTIYGAGLGASWEMDLFGRVRHSVERAEAFYEKAMVDAHAVRIGISAEIGNAYFNLKSAQMELKAEQENIAALREIVLLVARRIQAGDLPETEKKALEARLSASEAVLPAIEARIRASALALGTLAGALPEEELHLIRKKLPEWQFPAIPAGERADILRRRPDILAAETLLAAASAEHGLAVAEQFPSLTINAFGGFQSLVLHDLPEAASQIFSVSPLVSWNIFSGGRIRAQIHAAEARQEQAAIAYQKAVLTALEEAERSMGNYLYALETLNRQEHAVAMAKDVLGSQKRRFAAGEVDMLDVLEAQRQIASLELARAQATGFAAAQCIASFRALGGGWKPE